MKFKWNIFGSGDSRDIDVMVYLDGLPESLEDCKAICREYNQTLVSVIDDPLERKIEHIPIYIQYFSLVGLRCAVPSPLQGQELVIDSNRFTP